MVRSEESMTLGDKRLGWNRTTEPVVNRSMTALTACLVFEVAWNLASNREPSCRCPCIRYLQVGVTNGYGHGK